MFALYAERHLTGRRSEDVQKRALRLWLGHFGETSVAGATKAAQLQFVEHLRRQGYGDGYVKRTFGAGAMAIHWAHDQEMIASLPAFLQRLPDSRPREKTMTAEEIIAFWQAIQDEHLAKLFMLGLNMGARPGAILGLGMGQIDLSRRLLDLQRPDSRETKQRNPVVKITETLRPWLERLSGPHVVSCRGRRLGSIDAPWQRTRTGLDPMIVPYTLRHTVATYLNEADAPANEIATLPGHAQGVRTTGHWYIRKRIYRPDDLSNVIAALDGWSGAQKRRGLRWAPEPLFPKSGARACG